MITNQKKKCDTSKNVTKMGLIIKGFTVEVSHLFAVPILVLWVGLEKGNR